VFIDGMFILGARAFLLGRLLSGQRKKASVWEKAEYSALPITSRIQHAFKLKWESNSMLLCFCPHPVPCLCLRSVWEKE